MLSLEGIKLFLEKNIFGRDVRIDEGEACLVVGVREGLLEDLAHWSARVDIIIRHNEPSVIVETAYIPLPPAIMPTSCHLLAKMEISSVAALDHHIKFYVPS